MCCMLTIVAPETKWRFTGTGGIVLAAVILVGMLMDISILTVPVVLWFCSYFNIYNLIICVSCFLDTRSV